MAGWLQKERGKAWDVSPQAAHLIPPVSEDAGKDVFITDSQLVKILKKPTNGKKEGN